MPARKTNEQFLKEVFELVGDEYTFLDEYTVSRKPMRVKHNKCGSEYLIKSQPFLSGQRCHNCFNIRNRTTETFSNEIEVLVGSEYSVIGEYKRNNVKIQMIHNECGNTFMMEPVSFTRKDGYRCPHCSLKNRSKTNEQFTVEAYDKLGGEYTILEEYINARKKIMIRHNKCGKEYLAKPSKILEGFGRCRDCKDYQVDLIGYIKEHANDEYELLDSYRGYHVRVRMKHKKCGYEYMVMPSNFIDKESRCPMCQGLRITSEMFEDKFQKLHGGEYTLLSKYKNAKTKVVVRHEECGTEYSVLSNGIMGKNRCPICISSIGELAIKGFLDEIGVKYKQQFKTNICRNIKLLPFDFGIYNDSDILVSLIEYDGKQHFESVEHFGGEDNFVLVKMRDEIKNEFCKVNGIPLLRIPYWEFDDMQYILFDWLSDIEIIKEHKEMAR